ncbi:MAG: 50S ribosomal protein L30 [Spirochaetes bacterium]|nr:50S ribosomal protein L30 [Spirochaetota bacterium]
MAKKNKVKVRLVRSLIGVPGKHKSVAKALGLRKRGSSVIQECNPAIEGMIYKIRHLVQTERVEE